MLFSSVPFFNMYQVSGLEMRKWMDELFPIIMDMLQDSSSLAKRQVCSFLLNFRVFVHCAPHICTHITHQPTTFSVPTDHGILKGLFQTLNDRFFFCQSHGISGIFVFCTLFIFLLHSFIVFCVL